MTYKMFSSVSGNWKTPIHQEFASCFVLFIGENFSGRPETQQEEVAIISLGFSKQCIGTMETIKKSQNSVILVESAIRQQNSDIVIFLVFCSHQIIV